jgi:acetyl esterase/lipase
MDTDDVLCRTVVQQAETILVSVDYRLAPEHSYPAQLKDTTKVLEWVSFSPFTVHPDHVPQEYQPIYSSYIELGNGAPVIGRAVMGSFFRCANMDACNSDGFNLWHIEDFHPFPRVYAAAASCDPLRDNGRILAAAMKEAGVAVREKQYHRVPHCFWFFNSLPQWQAFIEDVVTALQWIVGKSHAQGVGCGI